MWENLFFFLGGAKVLLFPFPFSLFLVFGLVSSWTATQNLWKSLPLMFCSSSASIMSNVGNVKDENLFFRVFLLYKKVITLNY